MRIRRLLYWSNYTVVRWQLLLTAFLLWFFWYELKEHYGSDVEEPTWVALHNFFLLIYWSVLSLFSFSIITTLCAWIFFLFRKKNKKIGLQTKIGEGEKAEAGNVPVTIILSGVLRPFLGGVRARLIFSGLKMSPPILLDENVYRKKSIIRQSIKGTAETDLHDRGIYDVEQVQLQFCDMFRLIAIPHTLHISQQLYTLPQEQKEKTVKAEPNTTEEQTERIEIPKPVEGEYINYKDFETGDDVRRIVWKIYARNGQLVVRIPETKDPYASHLYFYASFFDGLSESGKGIFETELLNAYKDKVRNIFEALQKNGYEVRIPHDQEVQKLSGMSDKKNDLFHITAANWQKDVPPSKFVNSGKAAFVCLSALSPVAEIAQTLGNLPMNTPVVVVRLSDAIISPFRFKLKNLFFIPDKQAADNLRRPWLISPLRSKLINNERAILRLLQQRGNSWIISASENA
jgi:hypothetical protein